MPDKEPNRTTYALLTVILVLVGVLWFFVPPRPDTSHLNGLTQDEMFRLDPKLVPDRALLGCHYVDLQSGRIPKPR